MSTSQRSRRKTHIKGKGSVKNGTVPVAQKSTASSDVREPVKNGTVPVVQKPTPSSDVKRPNQKQRKRRSTSSASRKSLLFWAIASLVVAIMVVIGVVWFTTHQNSDVALTGVVTYSNLGRQHVQGTVNYPQNPPVGGNHNPVWQNCGIYTNPIANENAVHSMEHGAVWITYQPTLGVQDVTQLQNLVHGHSYALLSPYKGLPAPVVISAWGVQLQVKSANDPRLALFLTKYEQGPQTQEPGAACSGGTGTPDVQ